MTMEKKNKKGLQKKKKPKENHMKLTKQDKMRMMKKKENKNLSWPSLQIKMSKITKNLSWNSPTTYTKARTGKEIKFLITLLTISKQKNWKFSV